MRSVAVIGRKGGSGKTTIAVHLAIGFHRRGRRTVLADADPQRSSIEVLKARTAPGPEAIATSGAKLFALIALMPAFDGRRSGDWGRQEGDDEEPR